MVVVAVHPLQPTLSSTSLKVLVLENEKLNKISFNVIYALSQLLNSRPSKFVRKWVREDFRVTCRYHGFNVAYASLRLLTSPLHHLRRLKVIISAAVSALTHVICTLPIRYVYGFYYTPTLFLMP